MDLAFALDNSARVTSTNFKIMKDFAASFSDSFKVGSAKSHIGLASFGSKAQVDFNFGRSFNARKIKGQIENLPYVGAGSGNIGEMLKIAEEDLFSLKGLMRRGTPKVLVMIVQGPADVKNAVELQKRAEKLKETGGSVNLMIINIDKEGSKSDELLKSIASKSSSTKARNYYRVDNAIELLKAANQLTIAKDACSGED